MIKLFELKDRKIAVVGMGVVGKAVASAIKKAGHEVLELDKEHTTKNYKKADLFFVCVPTPSLDGYTNAEHLIDVFQKIPEESIVVVRSTVDPYTAVGLNEKFSKLYMIFMPEFLNEDTAENDIINPDLIVFGIDDNKRVLWDSPLLSEIAGLFDGSDWSKISTCSIFEACLVKHVINAYMVYKNVFFNEVYDLMNEAGVNKDHVMEIIRKDSRIGRVHTYPFHKGGRGAGGKCLPKDFRNFVTICERSMNFQEDQLMRYIMVENENRLKRSNKTIYGIK